jgi:hypothetical protein
LKVCALEKRIIVADEVVVSVFVPR